MQPLTVEEIRYLQGITEANNEETERIVKEKKAVEEQIAKRKLERQSHKKGIEQCVTTINEQFKDLKLVETFSLLPDGTYDKKLDFERDI